ncbi:MAG: hypothetical protein ABIQ82_00615 [Variovorax sp.]
MAGKKRDLVIHYDEQLGKFFFYSTDVDNTASIRATEFDGVCPEVTFFRQQSADDAEMKLGRLVFSLIDLNSSTKIGIRNYEEEGERDQTLLKAELEQEATAGDPDAQHHLSLLRHSSAVKNNSVEDLARAESLLRASASQGHAGAISSLESWPILKDAAERRIASLTVSQE